jgi:tetratricopeptide (TPR) repeat protein
MVVVDLAEGPQNERLASKHELLSSSALMQLSVPARRFLHRRIGQILEREIDEHYSAATLWDCAKHWQLAGDTKRAFQLATSCGSYLMKVGLPVEAAAAYEKTLSFCTTDNQRLDVLKAQTSAFYGMSAWSSVIETSAKVRNLQKRVAPGISAHDEIELMDLRAQWQSFDWHSVLMKTTRCLYASDAEVDHRAEAGVMALMLSGMQCDREGSTRIHHSIEQMIAAGGVPQATKLKARMVYHVDHGNIDEGVTAAIEFVEEQRSRGDIGEVFRGQLNAAMACRVAGRFTEAEQLYMSAIDLANSHGLAFAEQRALPMFAHMALEIGQIDQAKELYDKLVRIPDGGFDQLRFIQQQALGVRLALCDGRGVEASKLLPFTLAEIANDPMYSKRTYNLALFVAVELAVNGVASKQATDFLKDSFAKARSTQHQAFSAFVLYAALSQSGDADRAKRILTDYESKYRRERWTAPRHLLQTIERGLGKRVRRFADLYN